MLSASWADNEVAWYENEGASPPVFATRVISTAANSAQAVGAADVDGDGDLDVLTATFPQNPFGGVNGLPWFENDGGSRPTFTERVISSTVIYAEPSSASAPISARRDVEAMAHHRGGGTPDSCLSASGLDFAGERSRRDWISSSA